jgi:hypothetical protein
LEVPASKSGEEASFLTSYFVVFILSKKCLGCPFQWAERNTFQRFLLCTSPSSSYSTIYACNYAGSLYTMLRNKKEDFNIFAAENVIKYQVLFLAEKEK